jgi:hypothetical protein
VIENQDSKTIDNIHSPNPGHSLRDRHLVGCRAINFSKSCDRLRNWFDEDENAVQQLAMSESETTSDRLIKSNSSYTDVHKIAVLHQIAPHPFF